jgi:soluble lytic murein transglycosylase-like protein
MTWSRPFRTVIAACALGAGLCAPAAAETTLRYAALIHSINPRLATHQTHKLATEVIKDAQREHLDARLLVALVAVESRWRPSVVSSSGAVGLGQLMPHTARLLGVDPSDSRANLRGTSTYLGSLLREFGAEGQRVRLAIAAYNAGPVAIKRAGGIPNSATYAYVRRVMSVWHAISARIGDAARKLPHTDTYVVAIAPLVPAYDQFISVDDIPATDRVQAVVVSGP